MGAFWDYKGRSRTLARRIAKNKEYLPEEILMDRIEIAVEVIGSMIGCECLYQKALACGVIPEKIV